MARAGRYSGMPVPRAAVDFWDYPDQLPALRASLPEREGLAIILPEIEPLEIFEADSTVPRETFVFPPYEFRCRFRFEKLAGEVFVQAREVIESAMHFLTLTVGHPVPVGAWVMSKAAVTPVHMGAQPPLAFLLVPKPDSGPKAVFQRYLEAYSSTERLLESIRRGSPLDRAIRAYGQSCLGIKRSALTENWKALEILGRRYGPKGIQERSGRRVFAFLESLNLAPERETFDRWRTLRNRVVHGSAGDEEAREINDASASILKLTYSVLVAEVQHESGVLIRPVWE